MALLNGCRRGSRLTKMQRGGHFETTEMEGVERKLDDENSGSAEFSAVKKAADILPNLSRTVFDPFRCGGRAGSQVSGSPTRIVSERTPMKVRVASSIPT